MASLNANERSFIEMMGKSEEHARHGFELLLKRQDFLKFFDPLAETGLFSANRNPAPVPVRDDNAVRIPYWTALDYLVACAKVAGETSDGNLAEKIMEIVRSVSSDSEHGAGHDNFHTLRKFAEILGLLPTTSITRKDLEHVQGWLNTKFDRDMVASALSDGAIPRFLASADPADWQRRFSSSGTAQRYVGSRRDSPPTPRNRLRSLRSTGLRTYSRSTRRLWGPRLDQRQLRCFKSESGRCSGRAVERNGVMCFARRSGRDRLIVAGPLRTASLRASVMCCSPGATSMRRPRAHSLTA